MSSKIPLSGVRSSKVKQSDLFEIRESKNRPTTVSEKGMFFRRNFSQISEKLMKNRGDSQRKPDLKPVSEKVSYLKYISPSASESTVTEKFQTTRTKLASALTMTGLSLKTLTEPKKTYEDYLKESLPSYTLKKVIGKGSYSTVRLAVQARTGQKFAIKTYEKFQVLDQTKKSQLLREIEILGKLNHPHIVKLKETIEGKKHFHIVLEYIKGGSLYRHVRSKPNSGLEETEARRVFRQILSAIGYCHSSKVVHRDIKLDNILLDKYSDVKIIDFGFSANDSNEGLFFCGTPGYLAPEIVTKKDYYSPCTDVWALGVLLYTMVCGKMPFRAYSEKDLFRRIEKCSFSLPQSFSETLKILLCKILQKNPKKRPTIEEILEDDWVCSRSLFYPLTSPAQAASKSLDLEVISAIKKLGFSEPHILAELQSENTQLFGLYKKLKSKNRGSLDRFIQIIQ